ncbi:MAG: glycoside hydrolase family 16 protein [Bacteroidota bacterium]
MKILIWLSVLFATVFCTPEPVKEWKLVWSDEFDGKGAPDPSKWDYDLGDGCPNVCGWGNNELEYYTNETKNVRMENGMLIIEAHKEKRGDKDYTSTRIVSRNKGDWTYAKVEVRAKLPKGRGTWPAVWMLPTDWKYGGWPASGEIDIMEHVGFNEGQVHGTVHTAAYNHSIGTQKGSFKKISDATSAFHIYSVEWDANAIAFKIDNETYYTFGRTGNGSPQWPFDQRFHIIMNIAVGGGWGGQQGVDESIWPQRMEVDYVRVYQ